MAKDLVVPLVPNMWRMRLLGDFVNGFILRDADGQVTLVDMGLKQSGPKVIAALAAIGCGPGDVTRLVLTHAHPDHAGGAAHVCAQTQRGVTVHADDAAYVKAGKAAPRDRSYLLGRLFDRMSSGKKADYEPFAVEREMVDGEVLPVAGGLRVVHTPGHSPGHVALLHEDSRLLITGDSIFNVMGLRWPVKAFCTDFRMRQQTAHLLGELDYGQARRRRFSHRTNRSVVERGGAPARSAPNDSFGSKGGGVEGERVLGWRHGPVADRSARRPGGSDRRGAGPRSHALAVLPR